MTEAEILADTAGYCLARLANLAIIVWRQTPTVERARLVCDTFPKIASDQGLAVLTVLRDGVGPPDGGVRKVFDQTILELDSQILGNALVIEFGGVRGSLVRAVTRTLTVVSRSSFPIETFSTTAAAAEWLPEIMAQRGGMAVEADTIAGALARL